MAAASYGGERLVNLLKLIGRPLKMIKLKGAITEGKNGPLKQPKYI